MAVSAAVSRLLPCKLSISAAKFVRVCTAGNTRQWIPACNHRRTPRRLFQWPPPPACGIGERRRSGTTAPPWSSVAPSRSQAAAALVIEAAQVHGLGAQVQVKPFRLIRGPVFFPIPHMPDLKDLNNSVWSAPSCPPTDLPPASKRSYARTICFC
ncbi:hypothetical protein ACCAA_790032 [Candidatus Accumulibacter aalborgensis]|uniref:Uncharacterized protein n=1 Tax=Candidatus Accumulibacter aalborgensis TaxID=1860102 RepID=A0A1A8XY11_9PROT|nr:hypothetical protein ACCAA_790032 [Candidatus Accumulibacter aalborgensis]